MIFSKSLVVYYVINTNLIRDQYEDSNNVILYLNEAIELYKGELTYERYAEFMANVNQLNLGNLINQIPFNVELNVSNFSNFHLVSVPQEHAHQIFKYIVLNHSISQSFL